MKQSLNRAAISVLQWVLALVILLESYRAFRRGISDLHVAHAHGIHPAMLVGLAGPEMIAAVLFLFSKTLILGGYALLVIFAAASLVHLLHGQLNFEVLMVYAAAVVVVMTHSSLPSE
jgi:hypothetical protein